MGRATLCCPDHPFTPQLNTRWADVSAANPESPGTPNGAASTRKLRTKWNGSPTSCSEVCLHPAPSRSIRTLRRHQFSVEPTH